MQSSFSNAQLSRLGKTIRSLADPGSEAWIDLKKEKHITEATLEAIVTDLIESDVLPIKKNLMIKLQEDPEGYSTGFFLKLINVLDRKLDGVSPRSQAPQSSVDDSELNSPDQSFNETHLLLTSRLSSAVAPTTQSQAQFQILPPNPSSAVAPTTQSQAQFQILPPNPSSAVTPITQNQVQSQILPPNPSSAVTPITQNQVQSQIGNPSSSDANWRYKNLMLTFAAVTAIAAAAATVRSFFK